MRTLIPVLNVIFILAGYAANHLLDRRFRRK